MATEQTIFDFNINVASPGNMIIVYSGLQQNSSTSGSRPWQLAVYLDGQLINAVGGSGACTDAPILQAVAPNVSPGSRHITATWYGHHTITFSGAVISVQEAYK